MQPLRGVGPFLMVVVVTALLSGFVLSGSASATNARVTCSKLVGIGSVRHPSVLAGCTDVAKTGGKGALVAKLNETSFLWTITWAAKHGTTIVALYGLLPKTNKCPKGLIEVIGSGTVIGGSGPAQTVIPKGQKVSAIGCVNRKTNVSTLLKGTKLTL